MIFLSFSKVTPLNPLKYIYKKEKSNGWLNKVELNAMVVWSTDVWQSLIQDQWVVVVWSTDVW